MVGIFFISLSVELFFNAKSSSFSLLICFCLYPPVVPPYPPLPSVVLLFSSSLLPSLLPSFYPSQWEQIPPFQGRSVWRRGTALDVGPPASSLHQAPLLPPHTSSVYSLVILWFHDFLSSSHCLLLSFPITFTFTYKFFAPSRCSYGGRPAAFFTAL